MANSPHVIETTAERFEADVIERSREVPVVLDFWAAWCQPCRMLAPLLETLAAEYDGKFVLVKADTDQVPQYASAFNVQGIPAVFALRDAQVVESFTGLLTESQLREWLKAVVPSEAEALAKAAAVLESSDRAAAEANYRAALALDPRLVAAEIGLARVLLAGGDRTTARQTIDKLEERGFLEPEAVRLKALLQLDEGAVGQGELDRLRQAAKAASKDSALTLQLAEALLAAGKYDEALPLCLEIVASERGAVREQARERMLDAFRVLGNDHELTNDFRRKLAMALY
jgi:putative thioredoxin